RTSAVQALREAGLKQFVMIFHCQDDDPTGPDAPPNLERRFCPWRGHFHVLGDGLEQLALPDFRGRGWVPRPDMGQNTSAREWLLSTLSSRSSWTPSRSIQRITYGGLASPSSQGRHGVSKADLTDDEEPKARTCPACARRIPFSDWLKAVPNDPNLLYEDGPQDPAAWRLFHLEEVGWGPSIWAPE
ncbi:MAG: hypothetical protein ACREEC_07305, partial [Thermoplasmata archaeon]